jgi:Spy/CpxP family protein refolding chaperone
MTMAMAGLLVALGAPLTAQVPQGPGPQRRAQLEARIHERFMDEVSSRLGLDEGQKERMSATLQQTMETRQSMALRGRQLRQHLVAAVQDSATAMTEIERILREMKELRRQEFELAEREDAVMAEFLTPRQQAEFLVLRTRFNERVQQLRGNMQRRGQGPMRPPGGPGTGLTPGGGPGSPWPGF